MARHVVGGVPRPMVARTTPLALCDLPDLPGGCGACDFWSAGPAGHGPARQDWVDRVQREWGQCGVVVRQHGSVVGHVVYAPAALTPGSAAWPTSPVSPDAVVVAGLRVDPRHTGRGLGKALVQAMARDLAQREIAAVEAFGDTRGRRGCLPAADFLTAVGFGVLRAHATTPRLRLDLASTITWREELGAVVGRLLPQSSARPAPASRGR